MDAIDTITEENVDLHPDLMNFFVTNDWKITENESHPKKHWFCQTFNQQSSCQYEQFCHFSHHPSVFFRENPKSKRDKLWELPFFQKWILMYPQGNDPNYLAVRYRVLKDYCSLLNHFMVPYQLRRNELLELAVVERQKKEALLEEEKQKKLESERRKQEAARRREEIATQEKLQHAQEQLRLKSESVRDIVESVHELINKNPIRALIFTCMNREHVEDLQFEKKLSHFARVLRHYFMVRILENPNAIVSELDLDYYIKFCHALKSLLEEAEKMFEAQRKFDALPNDEKKEADPHRKKRVKLVKTTAAFNSSLQSEFTDLVSKILEVDHIENDVTPPDSSIQKISADGSRLPSVAAISSNSIIVVGQEPHQQPNQSISAPENIPSDHQQQAISVYHRYKSFCATKTADLPMKGCCKANSEPSLFLCESCEDSYCLQCIGSHLNSNNAKKRSHTYKSFCPNCEEYQEDLSLCSHISCSSFYCINCQIECHVKKDHDFESDHTFQSSLLWLSEVNRPPNTSLTSLNLPSLENASKVENKEIVSLSPSKPTIITDSALEMSKQLKERIYNARVRTLLEDVVQPILVKFVEVLWVCSNNICRGCTDRQRKSNILDEKSYVQHGFDKIVLDPCLSFHILNVLNYDDPAMIAYKHSQERRSNVFNHSLFDVKAIIGIYSCMTANMEAMAAPVLDEKSCANITTWRNDTFHPKSLEETLYNRAFEMLPIACNTLIRQMERFVIERNPNFRQWLAAWIQEFNLPKQVADCQKIFDKASSLELLKYQKQEWLKEASRSNLRELSLILKDLGIQGGVGSKKMANLLCAKNSLKVLIIPPYKPGAFDPKLFQFLKRISWLGIVDLSKPMLQFSSDNVNYFLAFQYDIMDLIESVRSPSIELNFFVLAAGEFAENLFSLSHCVENVIQFCSVRRDEELCRYNIIPIFEDYDDLLGRTDYFQQSPSEEQKKIYVAQDACSLVTLTSYIYAMIPQEHCFVIKGIGNRRFGFSFEHLGEFANCLEILTDGFEAFPSSYNATALDFETDVGAKNYILHEELKSFLRGNPPSWFLFKEGKVVERQQVREDCQKNSLLNLIRHKDMNNSKKFTLVHSHGMGGTTIARHALYKLQNEGFVCMTLNKSFTSIPRNKWIDIITFLTNIQVVMGESMLGMVIYVDENAWNQSERSLVGSFIDDHILNSRCNEFCTVLVTTSHRTGKIQQDASVLELDSTLTPRETEEFLSLAGRFAQSLIRVKDLPFPCDQKGQLDIERAAQDPQLRKVVLTSSDQELISGKVSIMDVVHLRERCQEYQNEEEKGRPVSADFRSQDFREHALDFNGLLAFFSDFKAVVKATLDSRLERMLDAERRTVRLCVFYALFTSRTVPVVVADLFYRNGNVTYFTDPNAYAKQFSSLSGIVAFDEAHAILSVVTMQLAYLLAESKYIFGSRNSERNEFVVDPGNLEITFEHIHEYVGGELLPILCSYSQSPITKYRQKITSAANTAMLDAFCQFELWHPGPIPKFINYKGELRDGKMHNSFLIEVLLKTYNRVKLEARKISWVELSKIVRSWYHSLIKGFESETKSVKTFTLYLCRFIAYEASRLRKLSLIDEAWQLQENFPDDFQVCEIRGTICKTEVMIYKFFYGMDGDGDNEDESSEQVERTDGVQDEAQHTLTLHQDLDAVLDAANKAFSWFEQAAKLSKYGIPYPMVSAAQTLVTCLEAIRLMLCKNRPQEFVRLFQDPRHAAVFKDFWDKLKRSNIPDLCTRMLTRASNCNQQSNESGLFEQRQKRKDTDNLIHRCMESLTKLTSVENQYAYRMEPITFPIDEAKLMLISGIQTPIANNSEALAWSIVACALSIAKEYRNKPDQSVFDTLEKYFTASTLLAGFNVGKENFARHSLSDTLRKFLSAADGTALKKVNVLCLREIIQQWISSSSYTEEEISPKKPESTTKLPLGKKKAPAPLDYARLIRPSLGLQAYLSLIMVNVWQVLDDYRHNQDESRTSASLNLELLSKSTHDIYTFAKKLELSKKPRIFLAKPTLNSVMPDNPFCSFFFIETTALGAEGKALGMDYSSRSVREQIYRNRPYSEDLGILHGTIHLSTKDHSSTKVKVEGSQSSVKESYFIACDELSVNISFDHRYYQMTRLLEGDRVTFVLGISFWGLRAFGVQKIV